MLLEFVRLKLLLGHPFFLALFVKLLQFTQPRIRYLLLRFCLFRTSLLQTKIPTMKFTAAALVFLFSGAASSNDVNTVSRVRVRGAASKQSLEIPQDIMDRALKRTKADDPASFEIEKAEKLAVGDDTIGSMSMAIGPDGRLGPEFSLSMSMSLSTETIPQAAIIDTEVAKGTTKVVGRKGKNSKAEAGTSKAAKKDSVVMENVSSDEDSSVDEEIIDAEFDSSESSWDITETLKIGKKDGDKKKMGKKDSRRLSNTQHTVRV
jgi:hypothetical protein